MQRIPVSIITGFLGSGKTTLLNRLLRDPAMARTAVIVNEFGEIGLDHDFIEHSDDAVMLLSNGCMCCAIRSDLIDTLDQLRARMKLAGDGRFDRVIIETSGLAEPTSVTEVILSDPRVKAGYRLGSVVTTVDAVNGNDTLDTHMESVKQVALADRILITKTDMAGESGADLDSLRERVHALNAHAEVIVDDGLVDVVSLFDPVEPHQGGFIGEQAAKPASGYRRVQGGHSRIHHGDHDHRVRTYSYLRDTPWPMAAFTLFLDALHQNAGANLLRVKGIVRIAENPERPAVIHGAQQLIHQVAWLPQWPSDDRRTRIVFITVDIAEETIDELIAMADRMTRRAQTAVPA